MQICITFLCPLFLFPAVYCIFLPHTMKAELFCLHDQTEQSCIPPNIENHHKKLPILLFLLLLCYFKAQYPLHTV